MLYFTLNMVILGYYYRNIAESVIIMRSLEVGNHTAVISIVVQVFHMCFQRVISHYFVNNREVQCYLLILSSSLDFIESTA